MKFKWHRVNLKKRRLNENLAIMTKEVPNAICFQAKERFPFLGHRLELSYKFSKKILTFPKSLYQKSYINLCLHIL